MYEVPVRIHGVALSEIFRTRPTLSIQASRRHLDDFNSKLHRGRDNTLPAANTRLFPLDRLMLEAL